MSTRANIFEKFPTGQLEGIYCHFDGDLQGVGYLLDTFYNNPDTVTSLIALGSLSSLGKTLGEKIDFDNRHDPQYANQCVAYHRDRGEKLEIMHYADQSLMHSDFDIDYTYMYDHKTKKWYVREDNKAWCLLSKALSEEAKTYENE